ncbi:MAG: hypothetical protein AAGI90_02010 [Chlamydiota bacterium]
MSSCLEQYGSVCKYAEDAHLHFQLKKTFFLKDTAAQIGEIALILLSAYFSFALGGNLLAIGEMNRPISPVVQQDPYQKCCSNMGKLCTLLCASILAYQYQCNIKKSILDTVSRLRRERGTRLEREHVLINITLPIVPPSAENVTSQNVLLTIHRVDPPLIENPLLHSYLRTAERFGIVCKFFIPLACGYGGYQQPIRHNMRLSGYLLTLLTSSFLFCKLCVALISKVKVDKIWNSRRRMQYQTFV